MTLSIRSRLVAPVLTVVFLGACGQRALATEVAHESFNYGGTPNLAGANGGSGWGGPWFKLSSIPTGVIPEGMAWPEMPSSGGSALTAPYPSVDYTRYSRALAPYTAPDDIVYIAFLFRPNIGYGVGGGLAFGTWENGMVVGLVPGSGHYGLSGFQGPSSQSAFAPALNEAVLLVASAHKDDGGTITWSLHINPAVDGAEPATPDATMSIPGSALPQAVVIYNDGGFSTDEIRVASTWWSALGQPSAPCVGDLGGDGVVDGADLAFVLAQWGGNGAADFDASGVVDGADLAVVLSNWGPCP